jgi:hypothetical protein
MVGIRDVLVVGAVPALGIRWAEHVEERARRCGGEAVHVPAGLRVQNQGVARGSEVGVQHNLRQPHCSQNAQAPMEPLCRGRMALELSFTRTKAWRSECSVGKHDLETSNMRDVNLL